MAVRYVGGEPSRITCNTERKHVTRWMGTSNHKTNPPDVEFILCSIMNVATVIVFIAFIVVCFR